MTRRRRSRCAHPWGVVSAWSISVPVRSTTGGVVMPVVTPVWARCSPLARVGVVDMRVFEVGERLRVRFAGPGSQRL